MLQLDNMEWIIELFLAKIEEISKFLVLGMLVMNKTQIAVGGCAPIAYDRNSTVTLEVRSTRSKELQQTN